MKKIYIFGSEGFVGKAVMKYFSDHSVLVSGFSRGAGYDLTNKDLVKEILSDKPDYVINCAAHVGSLQYVSKYADKVLFDNLKLITNYYESLVETSPSTITINPIANCSYPGSLNLYSEADWEAGPMDGTVVSYGSTRRTMVHLSDALFRIHGIKSVNLLTPNIYGPGDSTDPEKCHAVNALIVKTVLAQINNSSVSVWGDGSPIREWLYVYDFARFISGIIDAPLNEYMYNNLTNIGQNSGVSIREVVGFISAISEVKTKFEFDTKKPNGAQKKVMDNVKMNKVFGGFEFTSFSDGLHDTYEYYKKILNY